MCLKSYEIFDENRFRVLSGTFHKIFVLNIAILGVLGKYSFFSLFVTKIELCLTGSKISKNKGGGSDPLWKIFITNLFLLWLPKVFSNGILSILLLEELSLTFWQ